jgi:hypothetical protein
VTVDLDRRLTDAESSALYAALEADPRVSDPELVGNGVQYGGFMHFDLEADSATQAARTGEAIATAAVSASDLRSAFAIHELAEPSGALLRIGDFDACVASHDTAYRAARTP